MEYEEYLDLVRKLLEGKLPPDVKKELVEMPPGSQLRNTAIEIADKNTDRVLQMFTPEEIIRAVCLNLRIFGYLSDVFLFFALYEHFRKGNNPYLCLKDSLYKQQYPYYLWFERVAEKPTTWSKVLSLLLRSEQENLLKRFLKEILQSENISSILYDLNFDVRAMSGLIETLTTLPEFHHLNVVDGNIDPELAAGMSLNVFKSYPCLLPAAVRVLTPERLIKSTNLHFRTLDAMENFLTCMAEIKCPALPEETRKKLEDHFENLIDELIHKYENKTLKPAVLLHLTVALINSEIQIDPKKINYIIKHFTKMKEDEIRRFLNNYISLRSTPLKIREKVMVQLRPEYFHKLISLSVYLYGYLKTNWIVMDPTTSGAKEYIKKVLDSERINKTALLDQINSYLYLFRHENLTTRIMRFLKMDSLRLPHPEYIFEKIIENPNIDNLEKTELVYFFRDCLMKQDLLEKPATAEKIYRVEGILARALGENMTIPEREQQWQKFLGELAAENQKNSTPQTHFTGGNKSPQKQITLF